MNALRRVVRSLMFLSTCALLVLLSVPVPSADADFSITTISAGSMPYAIAPLTTGVHAGTLTITHNAPGGTTHITLNGTGQNQPALYLPMITR